MALADINAPFCSFHWDIQHPFTPWRLLRARFYHVSSIFTQWNVMIVPWARGINWWKFKLCLQIENNFDGEREIRADRVQVNIFLQNRCIDEHDVTNVSFWSREAYAYNFIVNAAANDLQDEELLVVKVMLDIRAEPVYNNRYTIEDSRLLSEDLLRLHRNPIHSDLRLRLPDRSTISVHTCIFEARWNNFLILHEPNAVGEIEVNVSNEVLKDIVYYLYSGKGQQFGSPFNSVNYLTELFYLTNRYQINHLDRVLRIQNMQQRRVSEKDVRTATVIFPLWELVNGRFVGSMKRFPVNENTPYKFTFTIYVQTYCSSPWLSYSLTSSTGIYVHAQVNLYIRKIAATHGNVDQTYYKITHVHQSDYIIEPKGFVQSENPLFLGCPATFENFSPVKSPAQILEGSHSMLCTLKFTDGRILDRIQSTADDLEIEQGEMNRRNLLGDDLFRLFSSQMKADLRINVPTENKNQPDETYWIHRAIFETRVPLWRNVFQDYQDPNVMPEETRLHLKSEALPFVLYYIYSSRSHYVSPDLFDDIKNFAKTGGSLSLLNHIIRIRNEQETGDSDSE